MDDILPPQFQDPARYKRQADDAFGHERAPPQEGLKNTEVRAEGENSAQDLGTRIMAHMLGFHIPGVEPSTSFLPGYEWWPRSDGECRPVHHAEPPNPLASRVNSLNTSPPSDRFHEWSQVRTTDANYAFDFGSF